MTGNALQTQVAGNHYKTLAIQPAEYITANNIGWIEGCVIKYVTRHKTKGGAEDIKKAIHFLQLLLELTYEKNSNNKSKKNTKENTDTRAEDNK